MPVRIRGAHRDGCVFLHRRLRLVFRGDSVDGDGRRVELRGDAVGIGRRRLHLDAELVRRGGTRGDGGFGSRLRFQRGETSGGCDFLRDCLGADAVGGAVDFVIDRDAGGEEAAAAATRRLLDVLDDDVRREGRRGRGRGRF